jgi:hypothetical protein
MSWEGLVSAVVARKKKKPLLTFGVREGEATVENITVSYLKQGQGLRASRTSANFLLCQLHGVKWAEKEQCDVGLL